MENLFSEFPPVSKAEWLQKIKAELKGRPPESLNWELSDDITLQPFYMKEDRERDWSPIATGSGGNSWQIGENIILDQDPEAARRQVMEALEGGVDAPALMLNRPLSEVELQNLLEGVRTDFIHTHLAGAGIQKQPLELLQAFAKVVRGQKGTSEGALHWDPLEDQDDNYPRVFRQLMALARAELPGFKLITVSAHARFHGPQEAVRELTELLAKTSEYLVRLSDGQPVAEIATRLQLQLHIGTSYFVEMAKIRALKLLWPLVLKGFELTRPALPLIDVVLHPASQVDDPYHNMIRATTQAMSAILGGANRLTLLPADHRSPQDQSFSRRIARNVQHLLKLESHFDWVADPAAGSYYIEELTQQLARAAWKGFQEVEERGGYQLR